MVDIPCPRCDASGTTRVIDEAPNAVQYHCDHCGHEWFVVPDDPLRDRPFSQEEMQLLRRLRRWLGLHRPDVH